MKELEKIYETWCAVQSDDSQIVKKWCDIDACLRIIHACGMREQLEEYILDYGKMLEKQAFIAGFAQAFRMWTEIDSSDRM